MDDVAVVTWTAEVGPDAVQNTPINQPIFKEDVVNGLPVVRFDGNNRYLSTGVGSFTAPQPNTIFVVARPNDVTPASTAIPFFAGTATDGNNNILVRDGKYRIVAGVGVSGPTDATEDFVLLTALFNHPGAGSSLWVNGIQELDNVDAGAQNLNGAVIGGIGHPGPFNFLDGDIAEIIVYNAELSSSDRAAVELYLMQKWFPVQVFDGTTNAFKTGRPTIQAAIDAADAGDIVKIRGGTYEEDVDDDKGVTFSPGTSPDCVTIVGNFTVLPSTTFEMDIWGETVCDDYDQFDVTGDLTITDATLNIILDGYVPNLGDQFIIFIYGGILTGTFDDILVDNPGVEFTIDYGSGSNDQIVLTTSNVPVPFPIGIWSLVIFMALIGLVAMVRFLR